MSKLVRAVSACALMAAPLTVLPAGSAIAAPTNCSTAVSASRQVASAYCKSGNGRYRLEMYCTDNKLYVGNLAYPGPYTNSSADCPSGRTVKSTRVARFDPI